MGIDSRYGPAVAWDWIVPVAGTSGAVAISGMGYRATVRVAKGARESAERVAQDTWKREKRAEAYVLALEVCGQLGNFAQAVHPPIELNPPRPLPLLPTESQQTAMLARLSAYGSPNVRRVHETWAEVVQRVNVSAMLLAAMSTSTAMAGEALKIRERLDTEERPEELSARLALADEIRAEVTPLID